MITLAVVLLIVSGGAAYGLSGFDWIGQQQQLDQAQPEGPLGDRFVISSNDTSSVLAWWSDTHGLCLDVAFRGEAGTGCGFPVAGATAGSIAPSDQVAATGVGRVEGRGPNVIVGGVARLGVARVDLVLADGRRLTTRMLAAPAALGAKVSFFVARFTYSGQIPPPGGRGLVTQYVAYDDAGQIVGASPK